MSEKTKYWFKLFSSAIICVLPLIILIIIVKTGMWTSNSEAVFSLVAIFTAFSTGGIIIWHLDRR
jgi:hypothetical protein